MNKDIVFIRDALLVDSDGNKAVIVGTEGAENGHNGLVIFTQSKEQEESDVKTKLLITFTEV